MSLHSLRSCLRLGSGRALKVCILKEPPIGRILDSSTNITFSRVQNYIFDDNLAYLRRREISLTPFLCAELETANNFIQTSFLYRLCSSLLLIKGESSQRQQNTKLQDFPYLLNYRLLSCTHLFPQSAVLY